MLERMRGSPQQWSQRCVSDTNLIHRLPAAQHLLFFIARTYLGQQRYIPIGLWKPSQHCESRSRKHNDDRRNGASHASFILFSEATRQNQIWDVRDVTAKQPTNDSAHAVGVRAKYNAINILFIKVVRPTSGTARYQGQHYARLKWVFY
jgi:hypothetical protein